MATATVSSTPKSVENAIRRSYKRFNRSVNKLFSSTADTTSFVQDVNRQLTAKNQLSSDQIQRLTRQLYRRGSQNGGLPALTTSRAA